MYLWKYWRESRIALAVGMVLVGLLLLGVCVHHVGPPLHGRFREQLNPDQIYLVVTSFLTLPLGFLALGFGSFGVGRDLGEGSGSFVLSRPRARASFVWSDWGFGMAQLLLIILAANLVVAWAAHPSPLRAAQSTPQTGRSPCSPSSRSTAWPACCLRG